MWYLCSLERAGVIQKLTILEHKNCLVLSNTHVPVSGTISILFPFFSLDLIICFISIHSTTGRQVERVFHPYTTSFGSYMPSFPISVWRRQSGWHSALCTIEPFHFSLKFTVLPGNKLNKFFIPTLPGLVCICQAFPPMYEDVCQGGIIHCKSLNPSVFLLNSQFYQGTSWASFSSRRCQLWFVYAKLSHPCMKPSIRVA